MSKLTFHALAAAVAVSVLSAATPEAAFNAATVPGADLLIRSDGTKIYASPFYKKLDELSKKLVESSAKGDTEVLKKFKDFFDLIEKEGLSDKNSEASVVSLAAGKAITKIVKDAKESGEPTFSFDDFGLLVAGKYAKPLTKAGISKIVTEYLKVYPDEAREILDHVFERAVTADFEYAGVPGMTLTFRMDEDDLEDAPFDKAPVFAYALPAEGRVLYLGFEKDVKAAIDRANAGTTAEPDPGLKKLLDSTLAKNPLATYDSHGALLMPQVFRDAMGALENMLEGANGRRSLPLPGMLPCVKAAKAIQGMRFAYAYGEKLDSITNFVLDSAENAALFKDVLQINVLNMAQMGLFQVTGKNTAFAQSLSAAADGESTSILFSITLEDVSFFLEFFQKKMDEMLSVEPAFTPFFIDEGDDDDE